LKQYRSNRCKGPIDRPFRYWNLKKRAFLGYTADQKALDNECVSAPDDASFVQHNKALKTNLVRPSSKGRPLRWVRGKLEGTTAQAQAFVESADPWNMCLRELLDQQLTPPFTFSA
jgi:hypothetical protein